MSERPTPIDYARPQTRSAAEFPPSVWGRFSPKAIARLHRLSKYGTVLSGGTIMLAVVPRLKNDDAIFAVAVPMFIAANYVQMSIARHRANVDRCRSHTMCGVAGQEVLKDPSASSE